MTVQHSLAGSDRSAVMYSAGKFLSQGLSNVSGPFHPFGGAVDIIVCKQEDGGYKTSPWYVRFGKFQGVLKRSEKIVTLTVNGVEASFHMYLDTKGEAFFMREVEGASGVQSSDNLLTYPSSSSLAPVVSQLDPVLLEGGSSVEEDIIAAIQRSTEAAALSDVMLPPGGANASRKTPPISLDADARSMSGRSLLDFSSSVPPSPYMQLDSPASSSSQIAPPITSCHLSSDYATGAEIGAESDGFGGDGDQEEHPAAVLEVLGLTNAEGEMLIRETTSPLHMAQSPSERRNSVPPEAQITNPDPVDSPDIDLGPPFPVPLTRSTSVLDLSTQDADITHAKGHQSASDTETDRTPPRGI